LGSYLKRLKQFITLFSLALVSSYSGALEPEDVLGEYWKDPLFGEALPEQEYQIDVLYKQLWPAKLAVAQGQKVRFEFFNKTDEAHVFAFTHDITLLEQSDGFQAFINDEIMHANTASSTVDGHHHSDTSTDDAKSMVRTMDQIPTVTLKPQDRREIIIRFTKLTPVFLHCLVPGHEAHGHHSFISILANEAAPIH